LNPPRKIELPTDMPFRREVEHINLIGVYQWKSPRLAKGRFRPLRTPNHL
jgi:hypothetical protein